MNKNEMLNFEKNIGELINYINNNEDLCMRIHKANCMYGKKANGQINDSHSIILPHTEALNYLFNVLNLEFNGRLELTQNGQRDQRLSYILNDKTIEIICHNPKAELVKDKQRKIKKDL